MGPGASQCRELAGVNRPRTWHYKTLPNVPGGRETRTWDALGAEGLQEHVELATSCALSLL